MIDSLSREMEKTERRACLGGNWEFGIRYVEFEIPSKPSSEDVE